MTSIVGQTISHYEILKKIGQGGMGVIYQAQDTQLERLVALKFLPAQVGQDDSEKQRFILEAKAASALQHHNICTIHEIGEAELQHVTGESGAVQRGTSQMFICMDYYDGVTLDARIESAPLSTTEAIDIGLQITAGLAKAHEKDIVHRDLKPANLMLTSDGVIKILDFGLAKLGEQTKLTKEGTTLGTVAYMSPEQARATEVDHRTDIFSLGVILYEILTGKRPFAAAYEQAVIYGILNENPEPLTNLRAEAPPELERIVGKCLEKDPDARYHQIDEVRADLLNLQQALASGVSVTGVVAGSAPDTISNADRAGSAKRQILIVCGLAAAVLLAVAYFMVFRSPQSAVNADRSIAVLPFENMNPDGGSDYFSDGITEDIITQVSKVKALEVISRASVMPYKHSAKKVSDIGDELNVASVLQGSIRQVGQDVRITAQLVETNSEKVLWAETFDRRLEDIFAIQSEVAKQIAKYLAAELSPADELVIDRKPTENLDAYRHYLRGRFYWNKRTREDLERALEQFGHAIALDKDFALGYAGMALTHVVLGGIYVLADSAYPKAEVYCQRALELDPALAEAHAALGAIKHNYYWDYAGAEATYQTAIQHNPSYGTAHQWLAELYLHTRQYDSAHAELDIAMKLDPHSLIMKTVQANIHMAQGQHLAAIGLLKAIEAIDAKVPFCQVSLSYSYKARENYAEALRHAEKIEFPPLRWIHEGRVYAAMGDLASAQEKLDTVWTAIRSGSANEDDVAFILALLYGDLGDLDQAFVWFERAFETRENGLRYMNVYPPSMAVQADPRYVELQRKIGIIL